MAQSVYSGTVKWFSEEKGYGFIRIDGSGQDIFVHWSGIAGTGRRNLEKNDRVEFYMEESKQTGKVIAVEVTRLS